MIMSIPQLAWMVTSYKIPSKNSTYSSMLPSIMLLSSGGLHNLIWECYVYNYLPYTYTNNS